MGFTVTNDKIIEIDAIADPARVQTICVVHASRSQNDLRRTPRPLGLRDT
jgi:hypothetical protein